MSQQIVLVKNGVEIEVKNGISWTFFFFGWLVPLFRGQGMEALLVVCFGLITFGLSHFYFIFTINKRYKNYLLADGWVIKT
jgi:hypothetical protein